MSDKRVAAIDCGTNSIRLLIAEQKNSDDGAKHLVDLTQRLTKINRLGYGVDRTHEFDGDALDSTFEIEREYAEQIAMFEIEPQNIRFVATSASRDARNRDVFFETTKQILGVTPEVISGEEEAMLSFAGVVSAIKGKTKTRLVVDLGGGSTELIVGKTAPKSSFSMNIGSVRITERYFAGDDIPTNEHIKAATADIQQNLESTFSILEEQGAPIESVEEIVGVAGTVTTLTAFVLGLQKYERDLISGAKITYEQMISAADKFLAMPKSEIRELPFILPGRVDVIQAGALIWKLLLQSVQLRALGVGKTIEHTVTSEHDILDGIALHI